MITLIWGGGGGISYEILFVSAQHGRISPI